MPGVHLRLVSRYEVGRVLLWHGRGILLVCGIWRIRLIGREIGGLIPTIIWWWPIRLGNLKLSIEGLRQSQFLFICLLFLILLFLICLTLRVVCVLTHSNIFLKYLISFK